MRERSKTTAWLRRLAVLAALVAVVFAGAAFLLSRADGPLNVFAGGPLRSGEKVAFTQMDWSSLDALHELELEIVTSASSRTLWFSVYEGVPYIGCDLDCIGGKLTRWPLQIERDNRVVLRIDAKRVDGRLIHVPHSTPEYAAARAARELKYSGAQGGRAAASTAAHSTVVGVGEALTGRAERAEPGDRLYRVAPR